VGVYQTNDGGALVAAQQVPASINSDGNMDAVEYFLLQLVATPGDYNRDGDVDEDDYRVWRASFGTAGDLPADGNNNNVVDAADYAIWRNNYGTSGSGSFLLSRIERPLAPVPEPATILLLAMAACSCCVRRR
jgi:hypothetical protein